MNEPHVIRLNRVWELRVLAETLQDDTEVGELLAVTPLDARVDLPWHPEANEVDRMAGDLPLLLTRRFNRPSNLTSEQAVFVKIAPRSLGQRAYFNGEILEQTAGRQLEADCVVHKISEQLRDNNRLDLAVQDRAMLTQADVRLVIYPPGAAQPPLQ